MACWMTLSCTVGMPSIRVPPFGLGISTRLTAAGMYRPSRMCAQMLAPCFSKCARISLTVIPSIPGAPLLACCLHVFGRQYFFQRYHWLPPVFVQCAGLRGSYSAPSGRSPSGSDSVRSRPRRSTWYPSTFIATVAEFAVSALSTYKFKFGPSALSHLLRPLLTSLSTSLRLATSVALNGHRQGSPQVSHMCFTSYPSDIRGDFPVQYWVN